MKPMKKVGILVGHYGKGTGAKYEVLDEWTLARDDAMMLQTRMMSEGDIFPIVIVIDRQDHPWNIIERTFGLRGEKNILLREAWAIEKGIDLALELHYNSFSDPSVHGHEVLIPRDPSPDARRLGRLINDGMTNVFPNKNRGVKESGVMILRKLSDRIPAVLIEPAFIFEELVQSPAWREKYVEILAESVRKFFNP